MEASDFHERRSFYVSSNRRLEHAQSITTTSAVHITTSTVIASTTTNTTTISNTRPITTATTEVASITATTTGTTARGKHGKLTGVILRQSVNLLRTSRGRHHVKKRAELRRLHTAEAIARHSGSIFPPLQVAPSFACSVASLNQSPGHQLSGCHGLRCGILTDYQLGWGRPSTWLARCACAPLCFNTLFPLGDRRMDTPSEKTRLARRVETSHSNALPTTRGAC